LRRHSGLIRRRSYARKQAEPGELSEVKPNARYGGALACIVWAPRVRWFICWRTTLDSTC
jgi:hypothetical protein